MEFFNSALGDESIRIFEEHYMSAMKLDIDELLAFTVNSGASDLHISTGSVPMIRIHGFMRKLDISPSPLFMCNRHANFETRTRTLPVTRLTSASYPRKISWR